MAGQRMTLKELALKLGVSVSTVSKALSDSPEISEITKNKIKEVAKLLNYQPNTLARQLKTGKTNTIGVIVPSIQNDFFVQVLDGIQKGLAASNYNMIISMSNESYRLEKQTIDSLYNGIVDGFILAVSEETQILGVSEYFKNIINSGKPIVLVDRNLEEVATDKVEIDDKKATYNATKSLLDLGRKNFALVSTLGSLSVGKLRKNGFTEALDEASNNPTYTILETDTENIAEATSKLLNSNTLDAIVTLDEEASIAAFESAKAHHINVPKDMSLIGFLNERMATHISPSFSTINQHGIKIGEQAAKLMVERLQRNAEHYTKTIIDATLEHRDSTKI